MQAHLPQQEKFTVQKVKLTSPEASFLHGPDAKKPMIRFRRGLVLFADDKQYNRHGSKLADPRPIHTRLKTIVLQVPLGDVLHSNYAVHDGKDTYIHLKNNLHKTIAEYIQIAPSLLTDDNLKKPSQLIAAEFGWVAATGDGCEYTTRMLPGNDQRSVPLLKEGWHALFEIREWLFTAEELRSISPADKNWLERYKDVKIYISLSVGCNMCTLASPEVSGGLATVGGGFIADCNRKITHPSGSFLSTPHGVLTEPGASWLQGIISLLKPHA
jgi:hypothetical protein